jgi:hypothetical protein
MVTWHDRPFGRFRYWKDAVKHAVIVAVGVVERASEEVPRFGGVVDAGHESTACT